MSERKFFQVAQDYFSGIETVQDNVTELHQEPCPTCHDTGMVGFSVPRDHPQFGKVTHCPNPNCRVANANRRRLQEMRWKKSRIPAAYQEWTFERWYQQTPEDILRLKELATIACHLFAINLEVSYAVIYQGFLQYFPQHKRVQEIEKRLGTASEQRYRWLLITDGVIPVENPHKPYRTGKTTLASCVVNELDGNCLYTRCHDMIQAIQETYGSGESTESVMRLYQECPVLIVDELRLNNPKPDQVDKLTQILRYRANYDLPTLFTSNFTIQQLNEQIGTEAADLFHRSCLTVGVGGKQVIPDKKVLI